MSKSILVIDTPRTCFGCPLMYDAYGEEDTCTGYDEIIENPFEIPSWCPLLPLSEKEE